MPDDHVLPPNIVTDPDDDEGTPQAPTRRWPWSKPAVSTKATRFERRQFKKAARRTDNA